MLRWLPRDPHLLKQNGLEEIRQLVEVIKNAAGAFLRDRFNDKLFIKKEVKNRHGRCQIKFPNFDSVPSKFWSKSVSSGKITKEKVRSREEIRRRARSFFGLGETSIAHLFEKHGKGTGETRS
ncbi:hypothetical protein K0M31_018915 [Melipona bicolor]|uniref:Uncharacterized protein n=1 Tax=Melipona bicolor TaxID=60889 RepID=A0AA40G4L0_9HYME|nr:hypothetical protein K0M31_018915 [Melipona bicolor]